ncbi:MAG TPA: proline iminopeptidase-family hydrolase [Paraburkholderia sp.]|jgi:proline iminopeptidase
MKRRKFLATGVASVVSGATCNAAFAAVAEPQSVYDRSSEADGLNPPGIRAAGVRLVPVVDNRHKVWTKRIGRGPVKVLLLHGGPGLSHEYLEAMESFLPEAGIEMYYYDQLGSNNSDRPDDPSLWTLPRYVDEVEEVRNGLGLENFVLYGHGWGGILAIEYALRYQQHLRGLVISNMTASIDAYVERTVQLRQQLSAASLAQLTSLESSQAYDSQEYTQIMMNEFYPKMFCRIKPWPDAVNRSLRHMNDRIHAQMQGKSEFAVTGNLKGWDRWNRLREIETRTLTIGATFDKIDPADVKKMARLMPNARSVICQDGSHLCMWDDQAYYFHHLLKFLRTV